MLVRVQPLQQNIIIKFKFMSFQFIEPTEEQKKQMQLFRDVFETISDAIKKDVEDSRGKSLCLTKLEEASFWLNKGITKND